MNTIPVIRKPCELKKDILTTNERLALFTRDPQGRVFVRDGSIRRKVLPELFQRFRKLEASGRLEKLQKAGLVRTWIPENEDPDTLSHEFIPFVSYPQEWTIEMLQAAAVCILDVAVELVDDGLRLHDAHPWNVTFVNGVPVFLDFGSIRAGCNYDLAWLNTFFSTCYLPLWLRNKRLFKLSDFIAHEGHPEGTGHGVPITGRYIFRRRRLGAMCIGFWLRTLRIVCAKQPKTGLIALRNHIKRLRLPKPKTNWGQYYTPGGAYDDVDSYSDKAKSVRALLAKLPLGRILDLACNNGWFSGLAAFMGHQVCGVDIDSNAVEIARRDRARQYGFSVARTDLLWPTPRQGEFMKLPSAFERWQSDTVLMISLMHHLVLWQKIGFEALAAIPAAFGAQNVIVEWIPADDVFVRRWVDSGMKIPEWYSEHEFIQAFARRWPNYEKMKSGIRPVQSGFIPGVGIRQMYLFQK